MSEAPNYQHSFNNPAEWDNKAEKLAKLMQSMGGPSRLSSEAIIDALHKELPFSKASTVLDIGCGTGVGTELLISKYGKLLPTGARIIASDFSPAMVNLVQKTKEKELAAGNAMWDRVEARVLDAEDLSSLEDGSISHVMASYVLFAVPKYEHALKEILRVLSSDNGGGVFAMTSWHSNEWVGMYEAVKNIQPDIKVPTMDPMNVWARPEGAAKVISDAGFRSVESSFLPVYMTVDDPVGFSRAMLNLPAVADMVAKMSQEEIDKICEVMAAEVLRRYPTLPAKLPGKAVLSFGKK